MKHARRDPITGKQCGCPTCNLVFSTENNFDRHRRDGKCLEPSSIGMKLNNYGVWVQDAGNKHPMVRSRVHHKQN